MPRISRTRFAYTRWEDQPALRAWLDNFWGIDADAHEAYWSAYRSILYDIFASFARDNDQFVHHTHHRKILYYKNNEGFVAHLIICVAVDERGRAVIGEVEDGKESPFET